MDTYIVIGSYIPNFIFLSPVVSALRWYVSQSVSFSFYIYIYIYIYIYRLAGSPCFATVNLYLLRKVKALNFSFVSISSRILHFNHWKIGFLYSAFLNILVTPTIVRVPVTLKKQRHDKKQKNVLNTLEWDFFEFFSSKWQKSIEYLSFCLSNPHFTPLGDEFGKILS